MKKKAATLALLSLILLFSGGLFPLHLFANEHASMGAGYDFSVALTTMYSVRLKGDYSASIAREGKTNETHFYHFSAMNDNISVRIYDGDGMNIKIYNDTDVIINSSAPSNDAWDFFNFSNAEGEYIMEMTENLWTSDNGNYYGLEIVGTDRFFMNESQSSLYPGYSPSGNFSGSNDAMILGRGAEFSVYETYEIHSDGNFSVAIYDGDYTAVLVYEPDGTFHDIFIAPSNNAWDVFNVTGNASGYWKTILFDLQGTDDYSTEGNFYRIATDEEHVYIVNQNASDLFITYDFSSNAGVNRYAYRRQVGSFPPPVNSTPSIGFTQTQYQNIADDDGIWQSDSASLGNYASHRFVFTINESTDDIALLHILWNGNGRHWISPGATLFIWNYSANGYEEIDSNTVSGEDTLEAFLQNASHFVHDGELIILVEQNSYTRRIWIWTAYSIIDTDYVCIEVITK